MFKEESKAKSSKSVASKQSASTIPDEFSELRVRRLSVRDSNFLVEQMTKPSQPNAALKAAARKYW